MASIVSSSNPGSSSNNYYVYQNPLPQTDLISRYGPFSNTYQTDPTDQDLTSFSFINIADTSDKHFLFSVRPDVRSSYLARARGNATHKEKLINTTLQGEENRLINEGLQERENPDKYAEIFASRNWVSADTLEKSGEDINGYRNKMEVKLVRLESHRHMVETIRNEEAKLEHWNYELFPKTPEQIDRMKRIARTKALKEKQIKIDNFANLFKKGNRRELGKLSSSNLEEILKKRNRPARKKSRKSNKNGGGKKKRKTRKKRRKKKARKKRKTRKRKRR